MPRSYRHISDYEIEIIEKFNNGQSLKSIAEEYGFSYKQIRNFKCQNIEKLKFFSYIRRNKDVTVYILTPKTLTVAPHAGAWIETKRIRKLSIPSRCRTPRGCVD